MHLPEKINNSNWSLHPSWRDFFSMKYLLGLFLLFSLAGCYKEDDLPESEGHIKPDIPAEFPEVSIPEDNPITNSKVELGRYLFYDTQLSKDQTVSCASCHQLQNAFSDAGYSKSTGIFGRKGKRNSPTLTNVAYNLKFFAEGGVPSLEFQAIAPIIDILEMGMNTDTLVERLKKDLKYKSRFKLAWGDEQITFERITKSIATFERMLISSNSPFDKWNRGNTNAISASAKNGYKIFFSEKGDCFHCHNGFNFTDNGFHNTSLDSATIDYGRYRITLDDKDIAKFKTPTLRNIEKTFPYMHDGRFQTLEEAVNHYNSGGKHHPNSDALMRPLHLTDQEKEDLIAFLKSLTDESFINNSKFENPFK